MLFFDFEPGLKLIIRNTVAGDKPNKKSLALAMIITSTANAKLLMYTKEPRSTHSARPSYPLSRKEVSNRANEYRLPQFTGYGPSL